MSNEDRRGFLKKSMVAAVGGAIASAGTAESAQAQGVRINPNARAVLPNGQALSRTQILERLGLNPNTPPDAWLAIVACGSNASALRPGAREELMRRGMRLEGGAVTAPGRLAPR